MTDQSPGQFAADAGLRLERFYPHPIERVWAALIRAEHADAWLSPASQIDARSGGRVRFHLGGATDEALDGAIVEFRPPEVVEYAFDDGGRLRFELTAVSGGTRLVVSHALPPGSAHSHAAEHDEGLPRPRGAPRRPLFYGPGASCSAWERDDLTSRGERDGRAGPPVHTQRAGAWHRPRLAHRRAALRLTSWGDGCRARRRRSPLRRADDPIHARRAGISHEAGDLRRTRALVAAGPSGP